MTLKFEELHALGYVVVTVWESNVLNDVKLRLNGILIT